MHQAYHASLIVQAGTYGVMVLFGVLPAAMVWSERYQQSTLTQIRAVPGGRVVLLGVGGTAVAIIVNEAVKSLLAMQ
jgi:tyrosine-specific transport protein